eukprot:6186213-Pleurochrysis_carterae.AAC.5
MRWAAHRILPRRWDRGIAFRLGAALRRALREALDNRREGGAGVLILLGAAGELRVVLPCVGDRVLGERMEAARRRAESAVAAVGPLLHRDHETLLVKFVVCARARFANLRHDEHSKQLRAGIVSTTKHASTRWIRH